MGKHCTGPESLGIEWPSGPAWHMRCGGQRGCTGQRRLADDGQWLPAVLRCWAVACASRACKSVTQSRVGGPRRLRCRWRMRVRRRAEGTSFWAVAVKLVGDRLGASL